MAWMVLVAFHLYIRPGETIDLCKRHVIAPIIMAGNQFAWINVVIRDSEGLRPDRVGVFDNSLPFDIPSMQWVGEFVLARATRVAGKDARIFESSMEDFRKKFQQTGAKLGVQNVHASEDLSARVRDFNMFKVRGRWKALIVSALTFLPVVLGSPLLSTKKACQRMQLIWFCFLRIMFLTQLLSREFQVDHGRSCLACMGRHAVYNFLSCP